MSSRFQGSISTAGRQGGSKGQAGGFAATQAGGRVGLGAEAAGMLHTLGSSMGKSNAAAAFFSGRPANQPPNAQSPATRRRPCSPATLAFQTAG